MLKANAKKALPEAEYEKLVVVTGFGPFAGHEEVNASWEAVRQLPDQLTYGNVTFRLLKLQIPVEYEAVDKAVEEIWSMRPYLVIHCGVNGQASCVHIEKLAYNNNFIKQDFAGKRLADGKACLANSGERKTAIFCKLNISKIVEVVAENCGCGPDVLDSIAQPFKLAKVSKNVGNYLCGYIYLKSLDRDNTRTLFVHVPPLDKPFTAANLGVVLFAICAECLRQLMECEHSKKSGNVCAV